MATRYWVGGTGNWDNADTTHWAASSNGGGGQSVPTNSDTVIFDRYSFTGASQTCTYSSTSYCGGLDCSDLENCSYTGTISLSASIRVYGSCTLANNLTWTHNNYNVMLYGTGTGNTLTSCGHELYSIRVYNGGTTTLQDDLYGGIVISNGVLDLNGKTVNASLVNILITTGTAQTLKMNNAIIKLSGTREFSAVSTTTFTLESNSNSQINFTGTSNNFDVGSAAGSITFNGKVTCSSSTSTTFLGSNSFGGIEIAANKSVIITDSTTQTIISGGSLIIGASASVTATTGATIQYSGTDGANVDIDLSSTRTNITFSAPNATANKRHWVGDGGNWSDNTNHWAILKGWIPGASLPTSADDTHFDGSSFNTTGQTVTIDATAPCRSMDWTGVANSPTLLQTTYNITLYGSLTFVSGMTFTPGTADIRLYGYSSANYTVTTAGKTFYGIGQFAYNSGNYGTYTLQDDLTAREISIMAGTFKTNGKTVTITTGAGFYLDCNNATNMVIDISNSTINVEGTSYFGHRTGYPINGANKYFVTTGSTLNMKGTTQTLRMATSSASYNQTLATVNINSSVACTIDGSITFGTVTVAEGKTLKLTSGTTQTINSNSIIGGVSTASALNAVTADSIATLSIASDKYVWAKNCAINDIVISGAGTGYYSDGSTVDAQSTGWTADSPSTGPTLTAVKHSTHIDLSWV